MARPIKCDCGTIFTASSQQTGQSVHCPACGTVGHVPTSVDASSATGDTLARYAPCERCQRVRTIGGILCETCIFELHTGHRRPHSISRWAIPAAAACVLVVLALIWSGLGF